MKAMHHPWGAVALLLLAVAWRPAGAQTGQGYDLTWNGIDNGGGNSSGSGYALRGAVGTYDAGGHTGSGYQLEGGFLTVAGVGGGGPCVGDCDGDGEVTVDELVTMVSIALGAPDVPPCQAGDAGGDGVITVDEILTAVNSALNGCP